MDSTLKPHSKLPDVGTTIFTVMSALAQRYGAVDHLFRAGDFLAEFLVDRLARGDERVLVEVGEADRDGYCCTSCDAAVLLTRLAS